MLELDTEVV